MISTEPTPFHVKHPARWLYLARFTWNGQNANRYFSTQPAQSFHVKRLGPPSRGGRVMCRSDFGELSRVARGTYSSGLITSPLSNLG
jgi:hypothetical protein